MSFTIRLEKDESDRLFIRGLNARLCDVIEAPAHSKEEVVDFQDRFTASAWNGSLVNGATFIAINKSGKRLGYINVRESADEIADEKCGYVALLAVAEDAESDGVGRSLLQSAEQWARGMGYSRLALDVFASNDRGQRFYEKAGYQPETVRVIKRL